jgi:hypothetical protein
MRLMFASQRKAFSGPPLNVANKNMILTAVHLKRVDPDSQHIGTAAKAVMPAVNTKRSE